MRISIRGAHHADVPPEMAEYAEKKIRKLGKYFRGVDSAEVVHTAERNWHIVEVSIAADDLLIRAKERSDDMRTAVDSVVTKLEQQIKRYKGRAVSRSRGENPHAIAAAAATREEAEMVDEEPTEVIAEPVIARTKRVDLKPMPPDEAFRGVSPLWLR